jgi:gliding motility-associated-like protein
MNMSIRSIIVVVLFMFLSQVGWANHILGGNITWTCLGGNNYQITLTYYKDCFGNSGDPLTENVTLLPVGACGGIQTSIELDFVSATEISDLCVTELPNSSCSGGLNPGTQQVIYQSNVVLTPGCTWRIIYNDQDWNYFSNMAFGNNDAFIYAEINTTSCSNSLQLPSSLANPAIVYPCFNAPFTHTMAVNNPNGYTLTYTLVSTPTTGAGVSSPPTTAPGYVIPSGVNFNNGTFTVTNINPANGFTFFGNYVFTVRIEMFNGATLVGVMYETITWVVRNCAPTTTVFTLPAVQSVVSETIQDGPAAVSVCAGDSLCFDVEATNVDLFRSIDLTYTVVPALPGLTFTQSGLNPALGNFCVPNTSGLAGTYTLTVTATDDACPNPDTDQIVVTMVIHPNINVNFNDTTVCRNVNTAIVASGLNNAANYDWSVISGDLTPNPVDGSATLTVAPDSTTVYQVTGVGVPAQCTASQQITVHVALHNITEVISGETCNLNNGSINITPVGDGSGVYNYVWVGPGVVAGAQDQANLTGGNYSVTVTEPTYGCSLTENYVVTDSPQPTATFTGSATVCENQSTDVTLNFTAGQGPFDFTIAPAVLPLLDVTDVPTSYTFPIQMGTTTQTYTVTSITDASGCTANTNYQVTITVRPTVTATFVQPAPLCAGSPLCLQVDFSVPGQYNLTYNSGGMPVVETVLDLDCIAIATNLSATTIFDIDGVSYTSGLACTSADNLSSPTTVIVNPLPTVNLSGGSMTCPGASDQLTLTPLTGTGPWEVTLSEQGDPTPIVVTIPAGSLSYNFNVQPNTTGSTQYCVVSVEDVNCLNPNNSNLNQCTTSTAVAPSAATLTGSTTICEGGTTDLTLTLTAGSGPFDFTITPAIPGLDTTDVTSPYVIPVSPTSTQTYTITNITNNLNCPTAINTQATVTVLPLVTTVLQPVPAQCDGDPLQITVDHSAAGSYFVTYTVNGGAPITTPAAVADGGTITITPAPTANVTVDVTSVYYPGANQCPSSNASNGSITVTVNDRPTATLTGGGIICDGGTDDLNLTLTGTGPWTVSYTINNAPQTDLTVNASPFVWNVTPVGPGSFNYCITAVEDANCTSLPIPAATGCTTVQVVDYPTVCAYSINDTELCEGECATMTITVCETGLWTVNCQQIPDNAAPEIFVSQGSALAPGVPFTYNICPGVTTDYIVSSIYFDGAPQCATVVNDTIRVNVNGLIQVAVTDTVCDNIASSYTLQYTLSGGELPYDELPGGVGGSFAGAVFTSSAIPTGSGANFTFSDVNDCNAVLMTMAPYTCPVLTDAGSMATTLLEFCNTGLANGTYNNDGFLDGNDEQVWILVTNPANPIGTVVQTNCLAPQFNYLPGTMTYGTTYYILSAVGDDFGDGECVDLTAPNVSFSNGQPVIWYANPTAVLSTQDNAVCQGECVTLELNLTGPGPWTVVYSIAGVNQAPLVIPAGTIMPYTWCVNVAGNYALQSVTSGPLSCAGTVQGTVTVVIYPLPAATWSGSAETCDGVDHCFSINFTAGTGPWDVEIDLPAGANAVINNVATPYSYCTNTQGAYDIVWLRDANDCVSTANIAPVVLTVNALPTAAWNLPDTSFCEGTLLDVQSLNTGESPFVLYITEPAGINEFPNNWSGGLLQVNEPGTYTLDSIVDGNGCVGVMNLDLVLTEISLPIIDAGLNLEVCSGQDVQIGTPAVVGQTYQWSPLTGMAAAAAQTAQPTINIVSAGTTEVYEYFLEADNQGCALTDSMELTVYPPPSFGIVASADSICFGGTATLTADNGPGFSWAWDASASIVSGNLAAASIDVEPLSTETFEVTVSETHITAVCVDSLEYTVYVGDSLAVIEDFPIELCFGACDGEIELTTSGGFGTYSYDPSSELLSDLTQNLCPDTFDYTILDAIGCAVSGQIVIGEREPEFIDSLVITQPICVYNTGSIEVFDDVTSINITSDCGINLTVFDTQALFTGLTPPCTVTITTVFQVDGNPNAFCSISEEVEIESISSDIDLNPVWTSEQYCFDDEVCFEANPTGGTGGADVQWYNCPELTAGCFVNTDSPFCFNIQSDSTLYGVAIDGLGCYSDTVMVEAFLFPGIDLLVAGGLDTLYLCEYDTLAIEAAIAGGNGLIEVDWYEVINDAAPIATDTTILWAHPFYQTEYYAIASDNCSEPQIDTVVVVVHDTPEVYFETDTLAGCFPITVDFYDLTLINPGVDFDCAWSFGNGAILEQCADTTTYTYPGFGTFFPTLTITTEDGCEGSYTATEPIEVYGYPEMDFTWNPQPVTVLEHEVEFINLTQGAEDYLWNFYGTATSIATNPTHDIAEPIDMGIYPICLIATSEFGCADTLCQDILVESVLGVFVPNAFTPDGDGINDVFIPVVSGVKPDKFKFWVFNRWGDEIFFTDKIGQAWTGGSHNGEFYVQQDTYVWRIECEAMQDGRIEVFEGQVTILR